MAVKENIDLLNSLPESSSQRTRLLEHIDDAVQQLMDDEREKRRDPTGVTLALIFLGGGLWLAWLGMSGSGSTRWWLAPAGVLLVFGAVGLSLDAVPRKRDEKGRPID